LQLQRELDCDMQHVICLHFGPAIVGETGDDLMRKLTAMGSAVDVIRQLAAQEHSARRSATQQTGRIIVSRAVIVAAQRDAQAFIWRERELAGGGRIDCTLLDCSEALRDVPV
jgi:class 3 adenylate cyclase